MLFSSDLRAGFKNFITRRSGLYFRDHDLKDLEGAIFERMKFRRMDSLPGYYSQLTTSKEKEDEFRELLNLLTIKHTYFFRNEPHFKALREKVLPEIIDKKRNGIRGRGYEKPSLRIWSAGCSTGQEPYSIAMILRDIIPDIEDWDIHILATDASTEALKGARRGAYSGNSLKSVDRDHLDSYFTKNSGDRPSLEYSVDKTIKGMVNFAYFNFVDDDYPVGFDLIFCRNVVIYFELETTIKVMSKIHSSLSGDGYVFIGYSETLQFLQDKFKMTIWEDAIYYQKTKSAVTLDDELKPDKPKEEFNLDKVLEDISRAEALAEIESELKKKPPPKKMEDIIVQIIKSIHLKEYDRAIKLVEEAHSVNQEAVDPYYLAAEAFINKGEPDKAKQRLNLALGLDSFFAPAHYLLGCIYIEQNKIDQAKESLKKALYIDKNFLLAHFYLALAFRSENNPKNAVREYRNTLKLLSRLSAQDIIAYSGGFNAATLASVCKDNLERLKFQL